MEVMMRGKLQPARYGTFFGLLVGKRKKEALCEEREAICEEKLKLQPARLSFPASIGKDAISG